MAERIQIFPLWGAFSKVCVLGGNATWSHLKTQRNVSGIDRFRRHVNGPLVTVFRLKKNFRQFSDLITLTKCNFAYSVNLRGRLRSNPIRFRCVLAFRLDGARCIFTENGNFENMLQSGKV